MGSSDKNLWKKAIEEEKKSLEKNNTWEAAKPEEIRRKEVVTSWWILKIKDDGRYKARLVARGFQQTQDVDIFSPVVDTNTLTLLLAVSIQINYKIFTLDVKTAFLYGELEEPVFMKISEGYKGKICKLKKAPLKWNQCLTRFLKEKD
jgi:Reverse transcriptase (RNA-dependent DNA polymerase).